MRVGAVFPQTELGGDVGALRAYGQGVEDLGYRHVLAYDHVVGADPAVHAGWDGPYDVDTTFHEPFVMFGYLAGVTTALEFVTGVIILPQRQTALVAKQAAEVDLLTQVGSGLASESVGTQSNTRRSVRTSPNAACGRRNRSSFYDGCGPSAVSRSTARSTTSAAPGSRRFRCSGPSRCGSARRPPRDSSGRAASPTDGFR
jgi:hypothetical protein